MTTRIRIVINCEVQEGQRWFIFVVELKDLPQLLYVVCVSDKPCMIQQQKEDRVRPKFGFGYGAKTDLTYGFGLVSATAKVQWHKFGETLPRNTKTAQTVKLVQTVTLWQSERLLAVGGQGGAYASWYR